VTDRWNLVLGGASGLVLRRLAAGVPVVLGISILTFCVVNLLPGNAAVSLLGADAAPAQVLQLEAKLGLDQPAVQRYFKWLGRLLKGDLGDSLASRQPVARLLAERTLVTVQLVMLTVLFSCVAALATGLLTAGNPRKPANRACAAVAVIGISLPSYVVAIVLVWGLSVNARLFPSMGYVPLEDGIVSHLKSLTLPVIALGLPFFAVCSRFLRSDLIEQLEGHSYITTARAKGLPPSRVLVRHALPNSLIGLVTLLGLNVGPLMGGTVVIEQIFALPGLGQLLIQAVHTRDVVVVQAIVLIITLATLAATLLVDVLYIWLDPRIRYGRG
jgi:peptide/nickel transport system permease protein